MTDEPPIALGPTKILRAFQPGDVVIIESERRYSAHEYDRIMTQLGKASETTGVKFVLLDHGMRVAGREETPA